MGQASITRMRFRRRAADGGRAATTHGAHGGMITVGDVDHAAQRLRPDGAADRLGDGSGLEAAGRPHAAHLRGHGRGQGDRDRAGHHVFPAWTYNGRVPGPTLRATEGERLRIVFQNGGSHPHSMHFHGIHAARMDGVPGAGLIDPGEEFVYEFDAMPFGCHLYHCHALPLKRHIHKGMYGAFIIDPDPAPPSRAGRRRPLAPARHAGECAAGRSSSW